MTHALWARHALLPSGWQAGVRLTIDEGVISAIEVGAEGSGTEVIEADLIPGMPNLHSHAFQRAMAGATEQAGPAGDSFWTWRELMYRFQDRISPDDNEAIATQLYIEMLKSGYTSVAEFHYLYHDHAGRPYADSAEMAWRILHAADVAGIGLTLLPVFYAYAGFSHQPPTHGQRRFVMPLDRYQQLTETLLPHQGKRALRRVGIAPHSLRAVSGEQLRALVDWFGARGPIHIHAAEQEQEVRDALASCGQRPVAWLLKHFAIDQQWTLIHATHLDADECARLAQSGAVAGLCPSTEANLGDGIFPAEAYLGAGGRWGIGGDSHVAVNPFAELALLELVQRLTTRRRNVLTTNGSRSTGEGLYQQALRGGAQALGQNSGAIAVGQRADLVVLNPADPAMAEKSAASALDSAIFAPARNAVRDVMVAGQWVVRDGVHRQQDEALAGYRRTLKKLLA